MAEKKHFLSTVYESTGSSYMDSRIREYLDKHREEIARQQAVEERLLEQRGQEIGIINKPLDINQDATKKNTTVIYPKNEPGIFKDSSKVEAPKFGHSLVLSQSPRFKKFTDATAIDKEKTQEKIHHVVDLFLQNIANTSLLTSEKNIVCKKLVRIRETLDKYGSLTSQIEQTSHNLSDITTTNATIALEVKTLLEITLPNLNKAFFNLSFAGILNDRHYEQLNDALDDIHSFLEFLDNDATEQLNDEFSKAIIYTQKHYKR